jgi:predicted HTH domain antitoxin
VRGGGLEPLWLLTASTSTPVDRTNGRLSAASDRQDTPASVPERPILVSCDRNDAPRDPRKEQHAGAYLGNMTVTVELSDSALKALHAETPAAGIAKLRLAAAVKLFEMGQISSGAAAELAGIHRVTFLDQLKDFGVSPFQQSPDEVLRDIEVLRSPRG